MKLFSKTIKSLLLGAIAFIAPAVAGLMFTSCSGVIYDDLDPCPEGVRLRFVFDYNLEFANAFPSQVHCLTVLVYNEDGSYRETRTVTDPALLADENWRMEVDLPEGKYKILAYGGLACDNSTFHFVQTPAPGTNYQDLEVALDRFVMDRPIGTDLHPLFWGTTLEKKLAGENTDFSRAIDVEVKKSTMAYDDYTVYMMRDTNSLRLVMMELNGDPVSDKDFNFEITDCNTEMAWNNSLLPSAPFTYKQWVGGQQDIGTSASTGNPWLVAFAEFSFGRIVTSNEPRLHVTRSSDGSDVIDLPLIKLLELQKPERFAKMSLQEFLDRQHLWNLTFILDQHWNWIQVEVKVDNWTVRVNRADLQF
ncbi:MAG: FimB/Mfa2 family fimbrial subunit [Firmicutes bacterium]|nr:FimB/Mfa2 family fimbrial subunit [Bacillota bacterium]MCM1401786.1 FimB/Mfa2 family fimbrial subunit [Bacteroides sp.]MCM1477677.1 FimB/Mfa2 family fimbrial subunit [Bacteroides sp.]